MRPSPFIRSFGDMSSSTIEIVISIGRLVSVALEPSEFGPDGLHWNLGWSASYKDREGDSAVLTEDTLLHGFRIRRSPFLISVESEARRVEGVYRETYAGAG